MPFHGTHNLVGSGFESCGANNFLPHVLTSTLRDSFSERLRFHETSMGLPTSRLVRGERIADGVYCSRHEDEGKQVDGVRIAVVCDTATTLTSPKETASGMVSPKQV